MRRAAGFTLIELMIVIAIIAIIAAIAIPGLMKSQRASNERNAASSLKNISSAQVDFFSHDRDNNGQRDYWTRDVSGLYTICPVQSPDPIKLLELTLAAADSNPQGTVSTPTAGTEMAISAFMRTAPKAGYWYLAMVTDQTGSPYMTNTNGNPPFNQAWYSYSRFGFLCYPDHPQIAQHIFILNEEHTIYKRPLQASVRPSGAVPPGNALIQAGAAGSSPILQWPDDTQMKTDYSKLD